MPEFVIDAVELDLGRHRLTVRDEDHCSSEYFFRRVRTRPNNPTRSTG
jgi:hypothetical protein